MKGDQGDGVGRRQHAQQYSRPTCCFLRSLKRLCASLCAWVGFRTRLGFALPAGLVGWLSGGKGAAWLGPTALTQGAGMGGAAVIGAFSMCTR